MVEKPDGPLGGLSKALPGQRALSALQRSGSVGWERLIVRQGQLADGSVANLRSGRVLLSNVAISINTHAEPVLNFSDWPYVDYQLYSGFGLRGPGESDGTYRFISWNSYKSAMEGVVPISPDEVNRQTEDYLIRYTMYMIERLALDGGWFKHSEWGDEGESTYPYYPRGDRFATNARSFPTLAYIWAHLTMRRSPTGWVHVSGDADFIYQQLQMMYPFYLESDPTANFADRSDAGTPYIAYSQHVKERYGKNKGKEPPKGPIAAHSEALHFAWLMQGASHLYGDTVRERQWADIVARYHLGSKEMFAKAYPGKQTASWALPESDWPIYLGLIGYTRVSLIIDP
ncbi:MAG: hypothetical protein MN733_31460, partial [Nitrososphaera sp.]|nr:hypothetical protein [Nitrososphaera sp.]